MSIVGKRIGFIGLGNIGCHFAANLANSGFELTVFDKAGTTERAPSAVACAASSKELFETCEIVGLSLPNGDVVLDVVDEAIQSSGTTETIIDLSTIGIGAATNAAARAQSAGIDFLDCPVSGGVAAAREGAISVMAAGNRKSFDDCQPFFEAIASRVFYVGASPGLGQVVKLANNFLSATALAATSEAVLFGEKAGVDMKTMLDVINASSGRSAATEDKFVNEVLPAKFSSGFYSKLMAKDVRLFYDSAESLGVLGSMGENTNKIWSDFSTAAPENDFTEIYRFVRDKLITRD